LPVWLAPLLPILGLSCVFGIMFGIFRGFIAIHQLIHPARDWPHTPGPMLPILFIGSFVAAIGPGFILANLLLASVKPLRRILDRNAEGVPGLSFTEGTKGLVNFSVFAVPFGMVSCLIAVTVFAAG